MAGKPLKTSRCLGITKQGARCGGREVDTHGYCKHHGADLSELERLRCERADKALQRVKRAREALAKDAQSWVRRFREQYARTRARGADGSGAQGGG